MNIRIVDDTIIIRPKGYLTGGEETEELERQIATYIDLGYRHLVINLSETAYLGNAAIGILLQAGAACARTSGLLILCCIDRRIKHILDHVGLSSNFTFADTEEQALETFSTS